MHRTNIYLADDQCSALDRLARSAGISRAELIRRLLTQAIGDDLQDLAGDLAAIDESFGVLADEDIAFARNADARTRHLDALFEA